jgi:hypothetical protein
MSALGFSLLQGDIPRSIRLWRINALAALSGVFMAAGAPSAPSPSNENMTSLA